MDEVESDLKKLQKGKKDVSFGGVNDKPVFLEKDDRLRKIKGMILSAMNRAINDRDIKAIKELKKLVERLEVELSD